MYIYFPQAAHAYIYGPISEMKIIHLVCGYKVKPRFSQIRTKYILKVTTWRKFENPYIYIIDWFWLVTIFEITICVMCVVITVATVMLLKHFWTLCDNIYDHVCLQVYMFPLFLTGNLKMLRNNIQRYKFRLEFF
jgi:hypothetical protein